MQLVKNLIKSCLRKWDLAIVRLPELERLRNSEQQLDDLQFVLEMPRHTINDLLSYVHLSHSQFHQDLFVISELDVKRNGYFVEFGAADGVHLSNSYLLERDLGWKGILAEPGKKWHEALSSNRNCTIDFDCVWRTTGENLEFRDVDDATLSTLSQFAQRDLHEESRKPGNSYSVTTVSLKDLLDRHHAPRIIDYLSIDTEGSEWEILSAFDFNSYQISIITCEHNYTENRQKIHDLLSGHGYVRKYEHLSQCDDWYVLSK